MKMLDLVYLTHFSQSRDHWLKKYMMVFVEIIFHSFSSEMSSWISEKYSHGYFLLSTFLGNVDRSFSLFFLPSDPVFKLILISFHFTNASPRILRAALCLCLRVSIVVISMSNINKLGKYCLYCTSMKIELVIL